MGALNEGVEPSRAAADAGPGEIKGLIFSAYLRGPESAAGHLSRIEIVFAMAWSAAMEWGPFSDEPWRVGPFEAFKQAMGAAGKACAAGFAEFKGMAGRRDDLFASFHGEARFDREPTHEEAEHVGRAAMRGALDLMPKQLGEPLIAELSAGLLGLEMPLSDLRMLNSLRPRETPAFHRFHASAQAELLRRSCRAGADIAPASRL